MGSLLTIVTAGATLILVAVTWWYAKTTRSILSEMRNQSRAMSCQAEATIQTVAILKRSALPDLDVIPSSTPKHIQLTIKNTGDLSARHLRFDFDPPLRGANIVEGTPIPVLTPGAECLVKIAPPADLFDYSGDLRLHAQGNHGVQGETRWEVHAYREDSGRQMPKLEIVARKPLTQ